LRGTLAWDKSEFSGAVELGVDPSLLSKLPPGMQDKFFPKSEAGKVWMAVPLDGGPDRLTQALARELTSAHAAAAKSQ
jgi:hypothetical protein